MSSPWVFACSRFRGSLRRFESVFLVLALCFFAFSLEVDRIPEARLGAWHHLVEDGFKFLGITGGRLFWTTTLLTRLRDLTPARSALAQSRTASIDCTAKVAASCSGVSTPTEIPRREIVPLRASISVLRPVLRSWRTLG